MVPTMAEQSTGLPHLRAWREWRGYSVRELSARAVITTDTKEGARGAHVGPATISYLENGRRPATSQTIAALASALGITREQLLREEPTTK